MSARGFGPWDWAEFAERRGFRMGRGDLRYVILDLLRDRPSHGYELMQALEERFHGFYAPSAGTVYPTLQWLQDLGYVSVAEQDGRKVYTITDAGRQYLEEQHDRLDEVWQRANAWWGGPGKHDAMRGEMHEEMREFGREMRDFGREMRDMFRDFRHDTRWANPEKLRRVREVVERAAKDIESVLREPETGKDASEHGEKL